MNAKIMLFILLASLTSLAQDKSDSTIHEALAAQTDLLNQGFALGTRLIAHYQRAQTWEGIDANHPDAVALRNEITQEEREFYANNAAQRAANISTAKATTGTVSDKQKYFQAMKDFDDMADEFLTQRTRYHALGYPNPDPAPKPDTDEPGQTGQPTRKIFVPDKPRRELCWKYDADGLGKTSVPCEASSPNPEPTTGLATLSAGFKGPAQDAFDGLRRFYKTSEVVQLDTEKLLDIAKRKISTDADQRAFDLLNSYFLAQYGENLFEDDVHKIGEKNLDPSTCNHDLDCLRNLVDAAKSDTAFMTKMAKLAESYMNATSQCVAETSVIFDSSAKDNAQAKERASKATCISLLKSADDAAKAMSK
jgi:hypothetical protein